MGTRMSDFWEWRFWVGLWGGGAGRPRSAAGGGCGCRSLALGGAEFVAAVEPDGWCSRSARGVAEEVGAVGFQPGCFVEVAHEGVGVAEVLDVAVDAVDVVEVAADVGAVLLSVESAGSRRGGSWAISSVSWNLRPMRSMRRAPSSRASRASGSREAGGGAVADGVVEGGVGRPRVGCVGGDGLEAGGGFGLRRSG